MNPLFVIAAMLGLVLVAKNYQPKAPTAQAALDPNMDAPTAAAVAAALKMEKDPAMLTTFADKLQAAGYGNSAAALRAKAVALSNLGPLGAFMQGQASNLPSAQK